MNASERTEREREQYNKGFQRIPYDSIFSHCLIFTNTKKKDYLKAELMHGHGNTMLEIGLDCWSGWLGNMDICPQKVDVINVSETEIELAKAVPPHPSIKPKFHVMDAHSMDFRPESYDVVFGGGVLHHLDLDIALLEIRRVLKPDGKFVFWEPLGINPVSKIIRKLTPHFRTADEQPFRFREFAIAKKHFKINVMPFELFMTPAGIISKFFFKRPFNIVTDTAYFIDLKYQ